MFDQILVPQFKQIYSDAINALLNPTNSLAVPCLLKFDSMNKEFCGNCVFDTIQHRSTNRYNNTGPSPFPEYSICPVCQGAGMIDKSKDETIYMAVLFDHKYWLNWGSKTVNINDGMIQTICSIQYMPKIVNCKEMIVNQNMNNYGNYNYTRAGDPEPVGLGNHDYIVTLWKRL
jgi:hypothetical protein